jgi:hypothetical protein
VTIKVGQKVVVQTEIRIGTLNFDPAIPRFGKLSALIVSTDAGMQSCVSRSQPKKAPASISRSCERGSNVMVSNRLERRESARVKEPVFLVECMKQRCPMNWTEAGTQIDVSKTQEMNVPASSRWI